MVAGDQTGPDVSLPAQVPMSRAATTPVGPDSSTRWSKAIDTIAVIVAPILVPACVLAVVRSGSGKDVSVNFTIVDVAFGIVAVAFAVLTRALTGKGEGWKVVAATGVIVIVFETAIAVSRDSVVNTDKLVDSAADCPNICFGGQLHNLAADIQQAAPSHMHWAIALLSGALLCVVSLFAIWMEP